MAGDRRVEPGSRDHDLYRAVVDHVLRADTPASSEDRAIADLIALVLDESQAEETLRRWIDREV